MQPRQRNCRRRAGRMSRSTIPRRLAFETDCWDVHDALRTGNIDFVLLDVRGPTLYEASHVPGADQPAAWQDDCARRWRNGPPIRCSSSIAPARIATAPIRAALRLGTLRPLGESDDRRHDRLGR